MSGPSHDPEAIDERLAECVEAANATTDPAERVALHAEIVALRRQLPRSLTGCASRPQEARV